jgi:SAM-dependent methyltransferase
MNRNKKFYNSYSLSNYFLDYFYQSKSLDKAGDSFFELDLIFNKLSLRKASSVLLIGAGFGREIDFFLKVNDELNLDVLDFSENFLDSINNIYNSKRIRTCLHDLNTGVLPYDTGRFDLVVCLNTLEYLDDHAFVNILNELYRVIASEGTLFTRLLNDGFVFGFVDNFHLRKRSSSFAMITPRNFSKFDMVLSSNFKQLRYIGRGLKLNLRFLRFFYSNYFYAYTTLIENIVLKAIGFKRARAIYAVCIK